MAVDRYSGVLISFVFKGEAYVQSPVDPMSRFAVRFPPNGFTTAQHEAGELPYAGPDVVYGSRLDIVEQYNLDPEKWAKVPSMAYQSQARMYYGIQLTGHPSIGFWKGCVLARIGHIVARPLSVGWPFVLFFLLMSGKTKGHHGWVPLAFLPGLAAWFFDAYGIHLAWSYGVPHTESGSPLTSAGIRDTGYPIRPVVAKASMQSSLA